MYLACAMLLCCHIIFLGFVIAAAFINSSEKDLGVAQLFAIYNSL